mgnify:CR=1 FL=1
MIINPHVHTKYIDGELALFNVFSGDTHFIPAQLSFVIDELINKKLTFGELLNVSSNNNTSINGEELQKFISEATKSGIIVKNNK